MASPAAPDGAARFATGSIALRSIVTSAPASCSRSSSRGMAVILPDVPATAAWPSTSRCRLAHRPLADPTAAQPAPRRRRGGDEVQRLAALGLAWLRREVVPSMATISGSASRRPRPSPKRSIPEGTDATRRGLEAGLEPRRVERVDHVAQRVVAGDAVPVGQEAAQERQVLPAPQPRLDQVVGPGQGGGQHQEQDLRQRRKHLPGLARILQRRKMAPARRSRSLPSLIASFRSRGIPRITPNPTLESPFSPPHRFKRSP